MFPGRQAMFGVVLAITLLAAGVWVVVTVGSNFRNSVERRTEIMGEVVER